MAPRKNKKVKVEDDPQDKPADPYSEGGAGSHSGGTDNEEDTQDIDGDGEDKHTQAQPKAKKKFTRVPKSPEEKAATSTRLAAATQALLSDRFVWKDGKPEPFEQLRKSVESEWERSENESHCTFVERLHENWEKLERETRHELENLQGVRSQRSFDDDGEVTYVDFSWEGRKVLCETFLKVDLDDPKDAFKSSKILDQVNTKMKHYDDVMSKERDIRAKYIQHSVISEATDTQLKKEKGMKELIEEKYDEMDDCNTDEWEAWIAVGERVLRGEEIDGFPITPGDYKKRYAAVTGKWESWGSGGKQWTKDKKMDNDRNLFASDPKNHILRRPSVNGNTKAIYMAFDRNGKLMIFLDPLGIPWSYNEEIHKLLKEDAHEFYSKIKEPKSKSNKRHTSQREHLKDNPALKSWLCGSDHYGHWHAQQHTNGPILESGNVNDLTATVRQVLLQFLCHTDGPMTRVLDFWFGVWEPNLRQRYHDIYAKSPEFARLPPVNADHPDTYCLRVAVCNRPTDEHRDQNDIKGGLTGLVHLGDFEGAAMCINKLGIALDGYGDGAVLLFRGTEMKHYISQWSGNYRYAFDHTAHQSVENAIRHYEKTGRWAPEKDPEEAETAQGPKGAKKSTTPKVKDDKKPDAPAKPQHKMRKREREEDEEADEEKPATKKSRTTLPIKRQRQTRTKQ